MHFTVLCFKGFVFEFHLAITRGIGKHQALPHCLNATSATYSLLVQELPTNPPPTPALLRRVFQDLKHISSHDLTINWPSDSVKSVVFDLKPAGVVPSHSRAWSAHVSIATSTRSLSNAEFIISGYSKCGLLYSTLQSGSARMVL